MLTKFEFYGKIYKVIRGGLPSEGTTLSKNNNKKDCRVAVFFISMVRFEIKPWNAPRRYLIHRKRSPFSGREGFILRVKQSAVLAKYYRRM